MAGCMSNAGFTPATGAVAGPAGGAFGALAVVAACSWGANTVASVVWPASGWAPGICWPYSSLPARRWRRAATAAASAGVSDLDSYDAAGSSYTGPGNCVTLVVKRLPRSVVG